MDERDLAIIILAAGESRRFGKQNKLLAELRGKMLAAYVVDAAAPLNASKRIAITRDDSLDAIFDGYDIIRNPDATKGQGSSIALGAKAAQGHKAALFLLADMPFVSAIFMRFMVNKAVKSTVSHSGGHHQPPMLFFAEDLERLTHLPANARGKDVLESGDYDVVELPEEMARDIDTREDLKSLG